MTENLRIVAIGEVMVSREPEDVLVAYGLGSCVAVCLYDPLRRAGGMLHALLPTAPDERRARDNPAKYVDQGVSLLIASLVKLGARRSRLSAWLCGGAQMISGSNLKSLANSGDQFAVGQLNVRAAEAALQAAGLHIQGRATGGYQGRTVKLYLADGQMTVRTLTHDEQVLE